MTRQEVAAVIDRFLAGTGDRLEWDNFISVAIGDDDLDAIRMRCAALDREFPPEHRNEYCGAEGLDVLRSYVRLLTEP